MLVLICLIAAILNLFLSLQGIVLLLAALSYRQKVLGTQSLQASPSVCVVVPCFNESKVVELTIRSIFASEGLEIIKCVCVDDGSTDETYRVLKKVQESFIDRLVIVQQENTGKASALNRGLREVDPGIVVCIDADTQVLPTALARLARRFNDDHVDAASGQMLVGNSQPTRAYVHSAQVYEYERANNIERRAFATISCMTLIPGAIGAFRTKAIRHVGGVPSGTLAEDADLTMRLLITGHNIVHEPEAIVLTEAPDTSRSLLKQRVRWAIGKTQVLLRSRKRILEEGKLRLQLIWILMLFNQVVPLLYPISTLGGPLSVLVLIVKPASIGFEHQVMLWTFASAVLQMITLAACLAYARKVDQMARTTLGLTRPRLSIASLALCPVIQFLASWIAIHSLASGAKKEWNKCERTGDVRL